MKKHSKKRAIRLQIGELVTLLREQRIWDYYYPDIGEPQHEEMLFRELSDVFLQQRKVSLSRKELIGYALRYIHPVLGDKRLGDITDADCKALIKMLEEKLSSGTANLYFAIFASVLNYAVKHGYIASNPVKKIDSTDKIRPIYKERAYLTDRELKQVIAVHNRDNPIEKAFLFSCFCGLRKCDIFNIRWCDLRDDGLGGKQLYLLQKKTHTPLYLPLSQQCYQFIPDRAPDIADTSTIFPKKYPCQIAPALRDLMKRAGISKAITFHSARHTFATLLLTKGADIYTTSKLLGHTNIKTTAIYAKIVDEKKRNTVDLLNNL